MRCSHSISALLLTVSLYELAIGSVYQPVDISSHFNWRIQTLLGQAPSFPDGPVEFNGVRFDRPASGDNSWNERYAVGGTSAGLLTFDIVVGVFGVTDVFTLINTMGGEQVAGTLATLEFHGSGGAVFQYQLDGNDDIRDYFFGEYTNTINGTSTVNVFGAGSGIYDAVRLDMQTIVLPAEFSNQTLDFIRVLDNGGTAETGYQRLIISGVTVEATGGIPEPSLALVLGILWAFTPHRLR